MRYLLLVVVLLVAALNGCGGAAPRDLPTGEVRLAAPELVTMGGKMASGVPEGIFVSWTRNSEPEAVGYYLYRDTQSIPVPPPEELMDSGLRVNGGAMITQPPSGTHVDFTDMFTVEVGTTYYYRVTVVDVDGNESYPSNEMSWLVYGQTVTGLNPSSAFWGEDVTLTGDTFGVYDPLSDHVLFQTVDSGTLEGSVVSWSDTEIVATVPNDTITGPVYVVVGGTIAATDEDLVILSPHINNVTPRIGFVEQLVSIFGANFGSAPGEITIGPIDLLGAVQSWSDGQIDVLMPDGVGADLIRITASGLTTNGVLFRPRPEILSLDVDPGADEDRVQIGGSVTITGRYFGSAQGTVVLSGNSQQVVSWEDREITFTAEQSLVTHALIVALPDGATSNDVPLQIIAPLEVSITGVDPNIVYTTQTPPTLQLDYPGDIVRLQVYADGYKLYDASADFVTSFELPVDSIPNGLHSITAHVWGRGTVAVSNALLGSFYSITGDVDGSGQVNALDLQDLLTHLGLSSADAGYQLWYDTDGDGKVTEADASAIGYHFGEEVNWLTFPN